VALDLGGSGREQPAQPVPAGEPGLAAGTLPVTGEDWAAWLLILARPEIPREPPPDAWTALTWLARRDGYTVTRNATGPVAHHTDWETRRILIRSDLPQRDATRALLHELGHVLAETDRFHPPGATTARCRGVRKLAADSVAFLAATRLGLGTTGYAWPPVTSWAGRDPRARPGDIIRTEAARITTAAARLIAHLDLTVFGIPPQPAPAASPQSLASPAVTPVPGDVARVLQAAEQFYLTQLRRSWAPRYLTSRGLDRPTIARWRIGYAPAGWTTLLGHLRQHGHHDDAIQAAGLARLSSRGTLIDHFRDRVMLAIRDEHGHIVGFIGRARPGADSRVPKYLNSPDSPVFKKGDVLFGLHEAREQLSQGAVPVLVEGPFDAIAVSSARPGAYAGVAPCGTAFTPHQAQVLARNADLGRTGVLVALDGDQAGRRAAVRAHDILRHCTTNTSAVTFPPGRDPAGIFQADGRVALTAALQHAEPLAGLVIDACLDQWAGRLEHPEGQLGALHAAATQIASHLPPETAVAIHAITAGRVLTTVDDNLRPVDNPELPAIARILPPNTIHQITRTAARTGFEHFEVTAAIANAVGDRGHSPKGAAHESPGTCRAEVPVCVAVRVAAAGFNGSAVPGTRAAESVRLSRRPPAHSARRPPGAVPRG
jgi:DNA primase catalytic core